jgi:ketosteroid isomerase-like protein
MDIVREGYERFLVTREFVGDISTDDFVLDMSNYHGWPEQQAYEGAEGVNAFFREWLAAWDDWEFELEALHDGGDRVVALVRQRGKSKAAGMTVEMSFAQVFTIRDGKQSRLEMYSDRDDALASAGLS